MEAILDSTITTSSGLLFSDLLTTKESGYSTLISQNQPGEAADNDSGKTIEQRAHLRFQIKENAFAFIRDRSFQPVRIKEASMGEIAAGVFRCQPVCLGPVTDVSLGGLAFRHIGKPELGPINIYALDILIADCGFYLANLSFRVVSDVKVNDDVLSDPLETRQICVKFENLSSEQFSKLENLIQNFSSGEA